MRNIYSRLLEGRRKSLLAIGRRRQRFTDLSGKERSFPGTARGAYPDRLKID
jgi:hypothetical protein